MSPSQIPTEQATLAPMNGIHPFAASTPPEMQVRSSLTRVANTIASPSSHGELP